MSRKKTPRPDLIDNMHPLAWLIDVIQNSPVELAKLSKVPVNTIYVYAGRARRDKKLLLPPALTVALCRALDWPMYNFRPDLWPDRTWRMPS